MKEYFYAVSLMALALARLSDNGVEKILADVNSKFSNKLFTEVTNINPGKSVVISAFSALSPLAQLGLASVGESHDEILAAIGFPNDNVTKEVISYAKDSISNIKGVDLRIANRIYIPEGSHINEAFAKVCREVFNSDVKAIDFINAEAAADTINKWVENRTNSCIKDLVSADSLSSSTQGVLINAIYFKGNWLTKFDKELTRDDDFYITKDKIVKVPTMYKEDEFKYGYSKELSATFLELFYEGKESSFLVALPDENDGLAELQDKLTDPVTLQRATEYMYETDVSVSLPKLKIVTTIDLKDVLRKMGVNKLFESDQARLENIFSNKQALSISQAIQKAFIEINEEGTEAAAANSYISARTTSPQFIANKPFLFILKAKSVPIFSGVYRA